MADVRPARPADLPAFVEIYNRSVETTPFTFDAEPFTVATRPPWFDQFDNARHAASRRPMQRQVIGYACSAALKAKAAYATAVEVSIYTDGVRHGPPPGRRCMTPCSSRSPPPMCIAHNALVALPNSAAIELHRRFGLRGVAHLNEVGRTFGRY